MYYLLSVQYDGKKGRAIMKFYDDITHSIKVVQDTTGHKPYLLSDLTPEDIVRNYPETIKHRGFDHLEVVEKYSALLDKRVMLTKVVALDPLSIGGSPRSIREILKGHSWEAKIKYHHCYTYDNGLIPGMPYRIKNGTPELVEIELPSNIKEKLREIYKEDKELLEDAYRWAQLFEAPIPKFKRIAIDIEVFSPQPNLIPSPKEALYSIIAFSFYSSDGRAGVFLLRRKERDVHDRVTIKGGEVKFFDEEKKLIEEAFKIIREYPIILTFNGDHFDLPYMYTRAKKLGLKNEEIPIEWSPNMEEARVTPGIHIDLYKFFNNKSMQVYAFSNKYKEGRTLDEISSALIGEGKIEHEETISEMSYQSLALYSFRDAELTYKLSAFGGDLVMKLIMLMMRISKLSMDDLTRHNISAWIRNLLYFEHRRLNWLIPNPEDLLAYKGYTATKAIIKGKKYLGAIVIDPVPGIYFNVVVVDFASLYPSVIKSWNLSYETVRCPHKDCKDNTIPGTPHWVCRRRRGLMAKIVGYLRDLRVYIYKPLSKEAKDTMIREQYKVVQSALKVFINASYGVFGADTFPLYCPPVAESTTALGRYSIIKTLKMAYKLGIPVLYGDTDSLFLWNPSRDVIGKLIKKSLEELNIDLNIDKVYKWIAFSGRKKNYLGILETGDPDIKGLTGKKRNTPEFIKRMFYEIVKTLSFAGNILELENTIEEIKELIRKRYIELREGKVRLDDLAFRVALTKPLDSYTKTTPQHVKAARQLLRYGRRIETGEIISYVKTRDSSGVKAIQLARIDEIDLDKYVDHIKTTLEQILEALNISFNEIMGIKSLDRFI